jgi:hypothetical protein
MGEYDADYGTVLINQGNGNFSCFLLNGYSDIKELRPLKKLPSERKKQLCLQGIMMKLLSYNLDNRIKDLCYPFCTVSYF